MKDWWSGAMVEKECKAYRAIKLGPLSSATFDNVVDTNLGAHMSLATRTRDGAIAAIAITIAVVNVMVPALL